MKTEGRSVAMDRNHKSGAAALLIHIVLGRAFMPSLDDFLLVWELIQVSHVSSMVRLKERKIWGGLTQRFDHHPGYGTRRIFFTCLCGHQV